MRVRRIRPVLAIALLGLGLLGCSPKAAPTQSITLLVGQPGLFNQDALAQLGAAYTQKHPGVAIEFWAPSATDPRMPRQVPLDVDLLNVSLLKMDIYSNYCLDVGNLPMPKLNPLVDPYVQEAGRVNGKWLGIPIAVNPSMLTLSPSQFDKAGVPLPSVDWDLAEWEATSQKLASAGVGAQVNIQGLPDDILPAFGASRNESGTNLDTPQAKAAFQWMADQLRKGYIGQEKPTGLAITGPTGPNTATSLKYGGVLQPSPRGPAGRSVGVTLTEACVRASSAHSEAAIAFTKTLLQSDMQLLLAKSLAYPVTDSQPALDAWRVAVGDRSAQAYELSLHGGHMSSGVNPTFDGLFRSWAKGEIPWADFVVKLQH